MYSKIVSQVFILFLVMLTGFYARKKNFVNGEVVKGLSNLLLNITLPMLIISSFEMKYSTKLIHNSIFIVIFTAAALVCMIVVSKLLFYKYPDKQQRILRFCMIFSNCGFMGYPVMESIMGKVGVFYASVAGIAFNSIQFSIGVMIFTGKKDKDGLKDVFLNPALISVVIGLIIFIFSIKLPMVVSKTLSQVGGMTTPLSMIIVGAILAETKIKDALLDFKLYYSAFTALIIAPLIAFAVTKVFGMNKTVIEVVTILVAMPTASITPIFAEKYGGDKELASKCVFLSTILSLITIPLVISVIL